MLGKLFRWMFAPAPPLNLEKWENLSSHCRLLTFSDGNSYRGSCTVWHEYPSGRRCSSTVERWLCDVEKRIEWGLHEGQKAEVKP